MRYITPLKLYVTFSAFCFLAMSFRGTMYKVAKSDFNISIDATKSEKADLPGVESSLDTLFKKKIGKPDKESIAAIKDKFIARLPTTNFLLMPVVAGIFALLYIRQKRFYVEHLVFTLHYYSFIFLVVTVTSLLPPQFLVSNVLRGIALLWMLAYLPIALVRNYQQGYLKTFVKLGIFGVVYGLVVTVALFGTLVVTAWALPDKQELPDLILPAAKAYEK